MSEVLVDSNVFLDALTEDFLWYARSSARLAEVVINLKTAQALGLPPPRARGVAAPAG